MSESAHEQETDFRRKVFEAHQGGKLEVQGRLEVKTREELAVVYTPGVAQICEAIAKDPLKARELTIKKNTVAVFSDGSAVLGLGDLGPAGAIPVMEGKAMLFKSLAGVDAFPLCVHGRTVEEIVNIAKAVEPVFGGFNLEDISAPRCFEIERQLQEAVSVPVFHDDQHGTAVVTLAALYNALKLTGKTLSAVKVVMAGAGAAAVATSKILISAGARNVILCDRKGAIYRGRSEHMNSSKEEIAALTNPQAQQGTLQEVLAGADVFIGLSGPRLISAADVQTMAPQPIVFAMSNPVPEIDPAEVQEQVAVMATGRSDYPNQINNVLCFPGFFRGLLDSKATRVTEEMKLQAAKAIAELVPASQLNKHYIIPEALDRQVPEVVAQAVANTVKALALTAQPD